MENAYTKAGVDVTAGYEVVEQIKQHVAKTKRKGVMGDIGGFGGCFDLSLFNFKEPVLVSGTDGVGTKLLVAIQANQHGTIGIDCVAMCVNDILAQGAKPLFFLDYLATGKNQPEKLATVVSGVAEGCQQAKAALIGGETAEMPGMYQADEYDLAGFSVGIAEKSQLLDGSKIKVGDTLIGLVSSGIHSNGYSLVRKIFFERYGFLGTEKLEELSGLTLFEELLKPTRIYVPLLSPLLDQNLIHGMAHITGGGFVENIPRMLPNNTKAVIKQGSWPVLPIFSVMENLGQIGSLEMYEIFNMGIGMVLSVAPENVELILRQLAEQGETAHIIGEVAEKDSQETIQFTKIEVENKG